MNEKNLLKKIIFQVVLPLHSDDLQNMIDVLPTDNEIATAKFCDFFELGNWIYESILISGLDILSELVYVCQEKKRYEARIRSDLADIDFDYRREVAF